jgi:hypothetical protein
MKTLYATCLSRLGLSQAEAVSLHNLGANGLSTVKQWASGRRKPPPGIWDELRNYEARIVDRSEAAREAWQEAGEPLLVEAVFADDLALMGYADFVLTAPVQPERVD